MLDMMFNTARPQHRPWTDYLAWVTAIAALLSVTFVSNTSRADLRAKLRAGQIVSTSVGSSGIVPGRAMGVVQASAKRVFNILKNVPDYPDFVPRIKQTKKLRKNHYELLARLPWPLSEARAEIAFNSGRRGKTYVLRWKMVDGTLEKYEGAAWIQPWGKNRCLLTYQTLAVPTIPAPSALMNRGLRKAVTKMVRAVRKRAAKEHAKG
jgi:ribosome-associated toxin RatA of RatAB toxin-antitoxin module